MHNQIPRSHCATCLAPISKPNLLFDSRGVCSACVAYAKVASVNFAERRDELISILNRRRRTGSSNYDCIVPVSGGKDSTYQVVQLKALGANPLCVAIVPDLASDIGRRNLSNLKSLDVDLIEISLNRHTSRALTRSALWRIGSALWPETVAIFTVPARLAVQMRIPLVVWGENPRFEDGWAAEPDSGLLTQPWNGGVQGLFLRDVTSDCGLGEDDLLQYSAPDRDDLEALGFTGLFLGYYVPWDGYGNACAAGIHGFQNNGTAVEGMLSDYESLDNLMVGIDNYLTYLKSGTARATSVASAMVRRGVLPRADAFQLVRKVEGQFPWRHLNSPLETVLAALDLSLADFETICDLFTNRQIFQSDPEARIIKDCSGVPLRWSPL